MVRKFEARAARGTNGHVTIPLPFNPVEAWGMRDRYHLTGTVGGVKFRTLLEHRDDAWAIGLGLKSPAAAGVEDGKYVAVEVWPEGPQLENLDPDIADALAARPRAQAAFVSLAQFYRNGWLRWIAGTKRRPDIRVERIAEMVRLVEAGHKERPT